MRGKMLCMVLAGLLAVSLSACGSGGEEPSAAPALSQPVETAPPSEESSLPVETAPPSEEPSPSAEPSNPTFETPEVEFSLPEREYQPWQMAYVDFLTQLLAKEWASEMDYAGLSGEGLDTEERQELWAAVMDSSEQFALYDVDKDGVPELLVKYGECEADYYGVCYTFRDGEMVEAGEFGFSHSVLYTCPDRSAFLCHWGHMGYAELCEYAMEDGVLTEERVLFQEESMDGYTGPDEIVPGAEWIETYFTKRGERRHSWWPEDRLHASAGKALLLPICDWYGGPAATGDSSETARMAILAALDGERPLYGASGDHFYGDIGWTTWEEYIQPGAAYFYNEEPLEIVSYAWMDMNGDGQEECLLRVVKSRVEDDGNGKPWTYEATVVLSEQDGTVYAYLFGFYENADDFRGDGTVLSFGETWKLSFWKGQCYAYYARRDPSARPVEWVDGSPAG